MYFNVDPPRRPADLNDMTGIWMPTLAVQVSSLDIKSSILHNREEPEFPHKHLFYSTSDLLCAFIVNCFFKIPQQMPQARRLQTRWRCQTDNLVPLYKFQVIIIIQTSFKFSSRLCCITVTFQLLLSKRKQLCT